MDGAGVAIETSTYLDLLTYKLLGFLLIIQLVGHVGGLQNVLATGLYHRSGKR